MNATKAIVDRVGVTAADFNGRSFDGSPFDAFPNWLQVALAYGVVRADTPNCTDYAEWWVKTTEGEILAGPDHVIVLFDDGKLGVEKA